MFLPRVSLILCLAAAALPAPAQSAAAPAKKSAFDKPTFEAYLRHQFLLPPQLKVSIEEPKPSELPGFHSVTVNVSDGTNPGQQVQFYVSKDGQKIVQGKVFDINQNPFASDLALLKTDFQPSLGTPGAPVVIVLFSDFQCTFCREEAQMLRQNLLTAYPTQVRLYFKDFPLEQIHPWAKPASIAGRCIFRLNPKAFWDYHDWIFDKQSEFTPENLKEKVTAWTAEKKLDGVQFSRCLDSRSPEPEIERNVSEARALRVDSTPTLFVNGRKVPGSTPWPQLKAIIDWELDYSKRTGFTPESCCEVKLPVPATK
jgi:protein-disulfide isomerase